jgi:chromosome segregation ATPase
VAEIATLSGQLEAARREHANLRDERRPREKEAAQKLEVELAKAREAEAEWKSRHEKQAAEIAALAAALEEARQEHDAASGAPAAAGAAVGLPDEANGQREETALLRQAIADLGSEVVRIAGSLKDSDRPEDGASMPPDVIGVRERRSRARAQS